MSKESTVKREYTVYFRKFFYVTWIRKVLFVTWTSDPDMDKSPVRMYGCPGQYGHLPPDYTEKMLTGKASRESGPEGGHSSRKS